MRVFVDGAAGTTGLRITERLTERRDIHLTTLNDDERKDINRRLDALNACDIAFLCLPDVAAREIVGLAGDSNCVIIDASTAHRVDMRFAYGFPELSACHRQAIQKSKRISVPGCHASGFMALVYPLIDEGLLPKSALLNCHSLTGYSGGGKSMIAQYEAGDFSLQAPREYAITQSHKHLPEMRERAGLDFAPTFCPIVSNFYSGMLVTVAVHLSQFTRGAGISDIEDAYSRRYAGKVVKFVKNADENGFLSASALSGRDDMQIMVYGNGERALLAARFDNLGKGASGAAIQCMNISMGIDETEGLVIGGEH